jgi:hypothetical protein
MLYKTTLSPSIFRLEERTYIPFVGVLRELAKNCLIIVDSQGELEAEIAATVKKLPPKYQRQAKEFHKTLKARGRIVKYDTSCSLSALKENLCEFHQLAVEELRDLLIFTGSDCCLKSSILPKSRGVDLEEYLLSNRFMERKDNHILSDGQFNKSKMEKDIVIPLFETAKNVKIIDRYVGRSMINRNGNIEPSVVERYQRTLMWLLEIFDKVSSRPNRRFEIYTGVNPQGLSADEVRCLYDKMINFVEFAKSKFTNYDLSLIVKRETLNYEEMPHARYLITNQISVLVERGFDLLWSDQQMDNAGLNSRTDQRKIRDVAIALISEPGKIESSIRKLEDLVQ